MPKTRTNWIILMIIVALTGLLWIQQSRVPNAQANTTGRPPAPQIGHPAPDFTLETLDGNTLTLSDLRGTPVVLNFWATWCGPCRIEMPVFETVWQQHGGDVIFVGVDVGETPSTVTDFANSLGISYPLLLDTDATAAGHYLIRAYPTTFFLDADGVIQDMVFGTLNRPALESRITTILPDG